MSNFDFKILALSFWAPPAVRPQAILFGKMIPEWIRQGAKPLIATFKTTERWPIHVPIYFVNQRKSEGNIIRRNFSQYIYYQKEADRLAEFAKKEKVQILFSFSNPQESNIIGAIASKKTKLPFVSHFSDPWVDNPYSSLKGLNLLKAKYLEKLVVKQSKKIIFTNKAALDLVMKKYSKGEQEKAIVIPHSFDPKDYPVELPKNNTKFVISYIGTFYKERNPRLLLEALTFATKELPALKDKFEVIFVGGENPYAGFGREKIELLVKESGLDKQVTLVPPVDFKESLLWMKKSDCLVAIDADFPESPFLPSKVVDYAGARRPIVGITPKDSPTSKVLRELGFHSFSYAEKTELAEHIKNLILGKIPLKIKEEEIAKFEVKNTTAKLLNVFEDVQKS